MILSNKLHPGFQPGTADMITTKEITPPKAGTDGMIIEAT